MPFPHDADLDVTVRVYLGANPNDAPGSWPTPVVFTTADRVLRRPIQIRRGRGRNQKTAQAGSCTFWLDNTDGALTPLLPTSTYYPDWDLGVPCDLSVSGVGNAPPYTRHAGNVADVQAVMVPGTGGLNISAVQVTSAGVLRRLSQGEVIRSPLRTAYLGASEPTPLGYWPCEDSEGAETVVSGLPGGLPLTGTTTPHFASGIAGSAGALDMVATGITSDLDADIVLPSAAGFQIEYTALSDAGTLVIVAGAQWDVTGTVTLALPAAFADGLPHHRATQIVQNGANLDVTTYTDGVITSSSSVAGTLTTNLRVYPQTNETSGTLLLAHLAVYGFADMEAPTTRFGGANGYAGEQAHVRVERLCAQEGIPYSGNATGSVECGPQPAGDIVAVLQDAEEVDHGMLVEDFAFGLNYLASTQRENLDPIITVDLATYRTTSGTQGDVLTPVRNDARIRNEWTISRPNGSSATVNDPAHIAKRGRYNDSATVGVVDDTRLPDEAGWRVHEGTFDGLRYETVPLDLAANL